MAHRSLLLLWMLAGCYGTMLAQTGFFQSQTIDGNVQIGYGLAIGDVDGDRKPDILLADKDDFVWYRNGDWRRFVMVSNLTERDNVCLAARDIDGDGKVEVAVGARWNPGETMDSLHSGSVHYLVRPEDPRKQWQPVPLPYEPTVHRMRWVNTNDGYHLVVAPLHGRGNRNGAGAGARILAYRMPADHRAAWSLEVVDDDMHLTHNFDVVPDGEQEAILLGGKEGAKLIQYRDGAWQQVPLSDRVIADAGFGEIRQGANLTTGIQPMHGTDLVTYTKDGSKTVLTDSLHQGHALALADLLGLGTDQIVVGWRDLNDGNQMGIRLYYRTTPAADWQWMWIDRNTMACEDLRVADLNGDGRQDIIASGRSTHNLKIYWNHTGQEQEQVQWDQQIEKLIQTTAIPGLSAAILRDGQLRYVQSYGVKDVNSGEPVRYDTPFEAASLTKPVIAYAVCKLAASGQLDLDRPLVDYFTYPDIAVTVQTRTITARMVLTHTTGLPNWRSPQGAAQVQLQHDPGAWFSYSGEGFVYLARVCEAITGQPTHMWVDSMVFQPLGMRHSSLVWEDHFERVAAAPHDKKGKVANKFKPKTANAAASLHTTATDYARFLIALYHGEDLTPQWREAMLSMQQHVDPSCTQCKKASTQPDFADVAWGLGTGLEQGQEKYTWHWGDNGNFKAYYCMSLDSGDGVVYFANSAHGLAIRDALVGMILPGPHPAHRWAEYEQLR